MKLLYDRELVGVIDGDYNMTIGEMFKYFGFDIAETYNGAGVWEYNLFKIVR